MQYTADITYPKGKSSAEQTSLHMKLARGIIHKIDIVFPSGCAGLVNTAIFQGGHPIAPSTQGQTYSGNGEVIKIPDFYQLKNETNLIRILGWNEDTVYDHKLSFRFYVLPKWALVPIGAYEGVVAALKSLFTQR